MPHKCCVVGCSSRSGRDNLGFYAIPAPLTFVHKTALNELSVLRREKWLAAIGRADLFGTKLKNAKVCSKHFLSGKSASLQNNLDPDWVPSLNMGNAASGQSSFAVLVKEEAQDSTIGIKLDHWHYTVKPETAPESIAATIKTEIVDLPPHPEIKEEILRNIYTDLYNKDFEAFSTYDKLLDLSEQYRETLAIPKEYCQRVETMTQQEEQSHIRFHHKTGRITASNFKSVCQTPLQPPPLSLIKSICYPSKFHFETKATTWGRTHEKAALATYQRYLEPVHRNFKLQSVGLLLTPQFPQYAASPHALVCCECCGSGCLEIKCPYSLQSLSIQQFAHLKHSCLTKNNDKELILKKDHSYYYQLQMQMALKGASYCDFVLWTLSEFFLERVPFDANFWCTESEKALSFHKEIIMPELLAKFFTRDDVSIESWCICNGIDDGRAMICCGNDNCVQKWFHLDCAALQDVPIEPWYCETCSI